MSYKVWVLAIIVMAALMTGILSGEDKTVQPSSTWNETYSIEARFENVSGLRAGSDVTIAGVVIGVVNGIKYDSDSFEAVVSIDIDANQNRLPIDSAISVFTYGLMGDKYLAIEPGGAQAFLKDGSSVQMTQSSLILEQLIGQFLFNQAQNGAN